MRTARVGSLRLVGYLAFCAVIALACYLRPSTDDFDRFVYEALVRSAGEPIGHIYAEVKHESPRAEASSVMDSPDHLAQLEPLYGIRPLYVRIVSIFSKGLSPQKAINAVSAGSLFLIALISYFYTRSFLYAGILSITPAIITLGRMGTPDALSTLMVGGGCLALLKNKTFPALVLLMMSIWVRTDNVLVVLALLGWLALDGKLPKSYAAALAALALASVQYINYFSGNYGWKVLLHYSLVGGRYPAKITTGITLSQYAHAFASNAESLLPQLAPFLLLGVAAWKLRSPDRRILAPVALAAIARYLLFPSAEARYFAWACMICGLVFINSVQSRAKRFAVENRYEAVAA